MDGDRVPLTVVIAEDSALLRDGLVNLLSRYGHTVAAAVNDADSLLAATAEHDPDIVITDVRMPPGHTDEGLRAALELRARRPELPILVLSQIVEKVYASELLGSSTSSTGYLLKDRVGDVREFVRTMEDIAAGAIVIDPEVVRTLLARHRTESPVSRLSKREKEVLALMAQGMSNPAIARSLSISQAAVAKHIGNILAKLDLPEDEQGHRRVLAVLAYLQHHEAE
ncbi:response regulator [Saccharomonospora glauca]|jgi:DNA-binding NarL/FixJ family response regulator|uniref:Response regulator containing a CheY-like receiver domain and an HTH DNA-binding domain n=1 Tax=Saccharomonospora glauca K62 TaxID=928724 RepID=I1CYL7_9PSEU|nr:response regulator transcription factor [Saccharomonospora glauca]EIE97791.1 response regulator containing a CheY-like receiver domain and an HTH DNA-binding domain [Saccharomonospora glauca K62]